LEFNSCGRVPFHIIEETEEL